MKFNFTWLYFFMIASLTAQNKIIENKGEVTYITQTKKYIAMSASINQNEHIVDVIAKNGDEIFRKNLNRKPINLKLSESEQLLLIGFSDNSYDSEKFLNKLYDLKTGNEINLDNMYTNLRITKDGNYLYNSSILTDNYSPLEFFDLKTKEHIVIHDDWHSVASLNKNQLVVLSQVFIQNPDFIEYKSKKDINLREFIQEVAKLRKKNQENQIAKDILIEKEDSLKQKYGFSTKNSKRVRKRKPSKLIQTKALLKIYDLDLRKYIFEEELKDNLGNNILLSRDDENYYTITTDKNDNIYIYGYLAKIKANKREEVLVKFNNKYIPQWVINDLNNYGYPRRIELIDDTQLSIIDNNKIKKSINKESGILQDKMDFNISDKIELTRNSLKSVDGITFGKITIKITK